MSEIKETIRAHWLKRFEKPADSSDTGKANGKEKIEVVEVPSQETVLILDEDENEVEEIKPKKRQRDWSGLVSAEENADELEIIDEVQFKKKKPVSQKGILSPIKMFHSPIVPQKDSIKLSELFPSSVYKTFVFAMQIELELLTSSVSKNNPARPPEMFVIAQDIFGYEEYGNSYKAKLHTIVAGDKWRLHHSKMIVNFHRKNGVDYSEIIIMTCNLTFAEFGYMGACFWQSPLLKKKVGTTKCDFEKDFIDYLEKYKKPELDNLAKLLHEYDFAPIKADFVGSVANNQPANQFGYQKLVKHLKNHDFKAKKLLSILGHCSSLAGPYKYSGGPSNIFTHLICPAIAGLEALAPGAQSVKQHSDKFKPVILFPTVSDVAQGEGGPKINQSYIFNDVSLAKNKDQLDLLLTDYLYKRDMESETKAHVAQYKGKFMNNHTKVYLCSDDYSEIDGKLTYHSLRWCFMGSMNLSRSAWGVPGKKSQAGKQTWLGGNWEAGVLIHEDHYKLGPELVNLRPTWNSDLPQGNTLGNLGPSVEVGIRLPFKLPILKSSASEIYTTGR